MSLTTTITMLDIPRIKSIVKNNIYISQELKNLINLIKLVDKNYTYIGQLEKLTDLIKFRHSHDSEMNEDKSFLRSQILIAIENTRKNKYITDSEAKLKGDIYYLSKQLFI